MDAERAVARLGCIIAAVCAVVSRELRATRSAPFVSSIEYIKYINSGLEMRGDFLLQTLLYTVQCRYLKHSKTTAQRVAAAQTSIHHLEVTLISVWEQ